MPTEVIPPPIEITETNEWIEYYKNKVKEPVREPKSLWTKLKELLFKEI
jgi:hypothetical protein